MTKTQLAASRKTDCQIAECLGWTEIEEIDKWSATGMPPEGHPSYGKRLIVPAYSSSTAALLALEQWQQKRQIAVDIWPKPWEHQDERWLISCDLDSDEYFEAPTLWLAICKLILATKTQVET